MVARRFASLLVALLTLHFTFISADVACAKHGDARATSMAHTTEGLRHRETGVRATDDTSAPCEIPVQASCCRLMTSCSGAQSFARMRVADEGIPQRGAIESSATRLPASPVASPDPPPPKL